MRQAEIEAEVWRCVKQVTYRGEPINELGNITCWFGPQERDIDDPSAIRFETDGEPKLQFWVVPSDEHFDVHVTQIGDPSTYDGMTEWPVPEAEPLPEHIFVADDPFRPTYLGAQPFSDRHYGLYTAICAELRPTSILEIGVRGGYSAWSMLKAVPDATYVGLDADDGTNGGEVGYMFAAEEMLRREFPLASINVQQADTQALVSLPRRFDLIHVDGAHNHDQALHDLELCAPHADHLVIDDVGTMTTVRTALIEFLERHPECTARRYDSWRGHALIDTRPLAGKQAARYCPEIFETVDTIEAAQELILNPTATQSTAERWQRETAWLLPQLVFPHGLVIDLGCGIGRLSKPIAGRPYQTVLGVDGSAKMRAMAEGYVGNPAKFAVMSPEMFSDLVLHGLRAQGALAVWAFQHMTMDDVYRAAQVLWNVLEPDAPLFTLDTALGRCVPVEMVGRFAWNVDGFDVPEALKQNGFMLHDEVTPGDIVPHPAVLRRWVRRR